MPTGTCIGKLLEKIDICVQERRVPQLELEWCVDKKVYFSFNRQV